jgi:hypothetical protein
MTPARHGVTLLEPRTYVRGFEVLSRAEVKVFGLKLNCAPRVFEKLRNYLLVRHKH